MPLAVATKIGNISGNSSSTRRKNDSNHHVSAVRIKSVARANPTDCSRENVERALEEKNYTSLCFVNHGMYILNEDEGLVSDDGWGDLFGKYGGEVCQVCAPPVLMALYLGRYDLVKGLVESGEQLTIKIDVNLRCINYRPIVGHIITDAEEAKLFTIGHYIMGDPNMPDELRLYLWTMIAGRLHRQIGDDRKKRGYSDVYGEIPVPVEFDYFTFNMDDDTGLMLFRGRERYIDTFLHSLSYIGERRRRYFRNVPNDNWRDIIGNGTKSISIPVTKILLEHGLYGDEGFKGRIISEYLTYRIENFGPLHSWELDMYEEIHKHYRGENLEYIYYSLLINRYAWLQERENRTVRPVAKKGRKVNTNSLMDRLWSMIKKIYPVDQPLNHLLTLPTAHKHCGGTTFLSKVRDAGILMEMYKKLTEKPVIIDESCSNLMIRDEDYYCGEDGYYLTKLMWLEKVDSFSYDDNEPLGIVQEDIIRQKSLDMLALAIRKGLLKGRHSDKAIEYCLQNEGLLNKIPCIVAYADK